MNLQHMAQEAVSISASRKYVDHSGRTHHLPPEQGSIYYDPDQLGLLPYPVNQPWQETVFRVTQQTTLAAMRGHEGNVTALNFASAKNPGGGFLRGAQAQEESIARSSTLYAGLKGSPYYDANRLQRSGLYTDGVIFSPEVWVFRDDHGNFLEEPYAGAIITAPAVNRNALMEGELMEVEPTMVRRGHRILEVAGHHKTDVLILGAWGCGVFGNDPGFVANMWRNHLVRGDFRGAFREVIFAIPGGANHRIFQQVFS